MALAASFADRVIRAEDVVTAVAVIPMVVVGVVVAKAVVWNGVVINMLFESLGIEVVIEMFDGVTLGVGVDMFANDIIVVAVLVFASWKFFVPGLYICLGALRVATVFIGAVSAVMPGIGTDVLADGNVSALWAALTTAVEFAVPKPFNELNR